MVNHAPPPVPDEAKPASAISGRPRPKYQPRKVACPQCGKPFDVRDERSLLAVCGSCGSHIELSDDELRVLHQGAQNQWGFELEIGDSVRLQSVRWEVAARLAWIEDDITELTREYLLFHPSRGSQWLSEYDGHWDVSHTARVMPRSDPFLLRRGDELRTWDDRSWMFVEAGEKRLSYVDGALPWIAEVGETASYAECVAADGSGEIYEIERTAREIEYVRGRRLKHRELVEATGKALPKARLPYQDAVEQKRGFKFFLKVAVIATLVNLFLWLLVAVRGDTVLNTRFSAQQLTDEVLSGPFDVGAAKVLRIDLSSPGLNNAWMAVDVGVVRGEDQVIHVDDSDMEYYHGKEGGESWSEGSRSKRLYLSVPEAGSYRLLLHAVSGTGETADAARHPLEVRVVAGAKRLTWLSLALGVSLISLVFVGIRYAQWKSNSEE